MQVPGFLFSALSANIKKKPALDLGLIYSEQEAVMAGVFTKNAIKAAPLLDSMKKIAHARGQAIVVNSGNANACTGTQGMQNVQTTASLLANLLGIEDSLVYVASTGVIGEQLPMDKITTALPILVQNLSASDIQKVSTAMMTTDTFEKVQARTIGIQNSAATLIGLAKGAGMIEPNMATMLCFVMTDAAIEPYALRTALSAAVDQSFNRITIDGDTSTNDTVLIMANGLLNNTPIRLDSPEYTLFYETLADVTWQLARMIVKDGEGATKLIEIIVKGAKNDSDASRTARAIARSSLVKTAIYGHDANWGRIIAAIGYSGAQIRESCIDIYLNNIPIVKSGIGTGRDKDNQACVTLLQKEVNITVDLGIGRGEAKMLTCDLTEDYIRINALYRT